jgi:hypothetical protein
MTTIFFICQNIVVIMAECEVCKKKLGLFTNICRCGMIICDAHKHNHECSYDYFDQQQKKLTQDNPVVRSDKFQRMY